MIGAASLALALLAGAPRTGPRAAPPGGAAPPVHVTADEVEYRYKERKAVFVGRPLVKLTREDSVLLCKRLVADNDAEGRISHAVCTGDVRFTRGQKLATCEVATYDDAKGTIVCEGHPVLHDGDSVLHGELLTYDLDQDRAVMTKAKGTVVQRPGEGDATGRRKKRSAGEGAK
ncbi:LptA/OstA family protein [Anaeromyxobacter paludicola]|uniref:Organic solvent tolerance-like N-terminal domain-containing protein n=1 Tax=Anaeromyxobacter paludicola TaxID=2918171 RepID=A0ABM7XDH0_9BACT|nr:LptA/OstA family protein [Anaeromyxobacter paludicola]BDG09921.1 hypothetical protein AMPC_30340 [Anaeromyxobacter paludicola]